MQTLETIKNKSQENLSHLVELGKQQPESVQTWGVTAATGVAGALTVVAVAKGVLAVVGMLANPPVALTIGALGGGALGWGYMQRHAGADEKEGTTEDKEPPPPPVNSAESIPETEIAPETEDTSTGE